MKFGGSSSFPPQMPRQEIQNSSQRIEETIFLPLQPIDGITALILLFLQKDFF